MNFTLQTLRRHSVFPVRIDVFGRAFLSVALMALLQGCQSAPRTGGAGSVAGAGGDDAKVSTSTAHTATATITYKTSVDLYLLRDDATGEFHLAPIYGNYDPQRTSVEMRMLGSVVQYRVVCVIPAGSVLKTLGGESAGDEGEFVSVSFTQSDLVECSYPKVGARFIQRNNGMAGPMIMESIARKVTGGTKQE